MPKRKRDDDSLEARLGRFQTELLRALKTAKAFERQRQSKRARDPTTTADKKARIGREVVVLKSLDISQAAKAHLAASILKHKPIAAVAERLPESIRSGVPKPEALSEQERAALHNVTSNLYNQSGVRAVLEKAVLEVCRQLRVEEPRKGKQKSKDTGDGGGEGEGARGERSSSKVKSETKHATEPSSSLAVAKRENKRRAVEVEVEDDEDEDDEDEDDEDEDGDEDDEWEGLGESNDHDGDLDNIGNLELDVDSDVERAEEALLAKYDKLLGGSSDSEDSDGDDDSDSDGPGLQIMKQRSKPRFTDDGISLSSRSPSPEPELEPSLSPEPEPAPPSKKAKRSDDKASKSKTKTKDTTTSRPGTSTFLPSLMGGYVSGSESEASEVDVAPPKKRLGQRQRQAIWEKKYGAGANHVRKQAQQEAAGKGKGKGGGGRDAGWDMRRGAVGEEDDRRTPWKKGVRDPLSKAGEQNQDDGAGAPPQRPQQRKEPPKKEAPKKDVPMHPSWVAKAKQKEMEAKAKSIQGVKAKKLVFDD